MTKSNPKRHSPSKHQPSNSPHESSRHGAASRRRLLKGALGTGAVMPLAWSQPVVNTVLLPAHAQMTVLEPLPNGFYQGTGFVLDVEIEEFVLLDWVVSPARAAIGAAVSQLCIDVADGLFHLASLSVEDINGSDGAAIACDGPLFGGDSPGQIDGVPQQVIGNGSTVIGSISVSNAHPNALVSLFLQVSGVTIQGTFPVGIGGGSTCKKVGKKAGQCLAKKTTKKAKSLHLPGKSRTTHAGSSPRRSLRRTDKSPGEKRVYRFVRNRHSGSSRFPT